MRLRWSRRCWRRTPKSASFRGRSPRNASRSRYARSGRSCARTGRENEIAQQVIVFRVLAHETLQELAFDRELASLRRHRLQGRPRQLRADALAGQFRGHLGMFERDRTRRLAVADEGDRAADVEFKPARGFIVAE